MRRDSLEKAILQSSSEGNTIFKRLFLFLCISFWLHWVFIAVCRPSLIAANGGYSLVMVRGLSCSACPLHWQVDS